MGTAPSPISGPPLISSGTAIGIDTVLVEGCKHKLEITVPVEEVEQETDRIVGEWKDKVRLPGFRVGKVPAGMIRSRFASEIRQEVLEKLVPRSLRNAVEKEHLDIVGSPSVKDIHFEKNEPLKFTAEFEVSPTFELEEYQGLEVEYETPEITDKDVDDRLEQVRQQKAEYINLDPRPVQLGDIAVVSLRSVAGIEGEPIHNDEMTLEVGKEDTLEDFTRNLTGMEPGQEKEFDVTYPEDYGSDRVAGKTVRFHVALKMIRQKELPELNDDFAEDLGDYRNLGELRDALRNSIQGEREFIAQQEAKTALVERLTDMHDFPVPEAYIEGQIEANVRSRLSEMVARGLDPRNLKVDWNKLKESQREQATRDVKASMIISRIAEREAVEVLRDEVDRHVARIAAERKEPVPAVRKELEESGDLGRIANRIRTEKTLNLLFEKARKVAKQS